MTALRIVLPGGSGHLGTLLARHFHGRGDHVTVLSRDSKPAPWHVINWDGTTLGNWVSTLDGADVVINLAGRSVDCRYTPANREAIIQSRVQSTRVIGEAVARLGSPPKLWMNSSTATLYRHALDRPMDECTGEFGGSEPGVPETWSFSIDVATQWENAFFSAPTPFTRRIALRSAMVMSADRDGVFDVLLRLVRFGLGGRAGSGQQFVSWVHETDFIRAIEFLIANEPFDGPVNIASPNPVPNCEFMQALRQAWGIPFGLSVNRAFLEIGAIFLRTETELILKSRRIVPGRLLQSGFRFRFPEWTSAAKDLVAAWRQGGAKNELVP